MSKFTVPYFQTPNEIFEIDLKANEKLVYMYLCRCGNDGKDAFPSYQTIATKCSIGKSTAIRCMNVLVDKGLVVKKYRFKEGENYSNVYKVDYDLGGVIARLGSITDTLGSSTVTPNKEQVIKNQIEINNILHLFDEKTCSLLKLLNDFSIKTFNKPIRRHDPDKSYDMLEVWIEDCDEEEWNDIFERNLTNYNYCNMDYLNLIIEREK